MKNEERLNKWLKDWSKAQDNNPHFKATQKPAGNKKLVSETYAPKSTPPAPKLRNVDAKYWQQVYQSMRGSKGQTENLNEQKINKDPLASEPLGKQRETPSEKSIGQKTKEELNAPNPIYPSTRGDDSRKHVTPEWADGVKLRELVNMKHSLYELEVRLNSSPKFGSYGPEAPEVKKIQDQIDALKDKINELSNSLSPDFIEDENS